MRLGGGRLHARQDRGSVQAHQGEGGGWAQAWQDVHRAVPGA